MPITTKVVSSNPAHHELYWIERYLIKFVSNLWVCGFLQVSSTVKTDRHDITEILLKLVLNTLTLTPVGN
jgi:hypothetical protein